MYITIKSVIVYDIVYISSMYFESYRTYQFIRLKCNLCKQPYGLLYILFESKIVANALEMERN